MREPGQILLVACYELGRQPLAVAWPAAFLERAGYAPAVLDLSVEPFDTEKVARAHVVAISVPMHTALRLGVIAAQRIRTVNPSAHICVYGLYATLNADELLTTCADTVLAGEIEEQLLDLVRHVEAAGPVGPAETRRANASSGERVSAGPRAVLAKLDFPVPARHALPRLEKYATWSSSSTAPTVSAEFAAPGGTTAPYRPSLPTATTKSVP